MRVTGDDVVVSAEDTGVMDNSHRQPPEQAEQAAPCIRPYMGSQPVPQEVRQVIDQGSVSEMIFSPPIMPVCLNRIPAIRAEDDHPATGPEHTHHLLHRRLIIPDMLDHFVREDQIEGVVRVGDGLSRCNVDVRDALEGRLSPIFLNIKGIHMGRVFQQAGGVSPQPAACLQYPGISGLPPAADHRQAPLLPRPPDVAGSAPLSQFLVVGGHSALCMPLSPPEPVSL